MTKTREEYAAEGFLIVARMSAERRERERKEKQERSAPASIRSSAGIDTNSRQYETRVADPAATAAAIIEAGRRRRGEIDDTTPSPSARPAATLAEQIIDAGRRRRGER